MWRQDVNQAADRQAGGGAGRSRVWSCLRWWRVATRAANTAVTIADPV